MYQEIVGGERGGEHLQNWEVLTYFRSETSTEIFKLPPTFSITFAGVTFTFQSTCPFTIAPPPDNVTLNFFKLGVLPFASFS